MTEYSSVENSNDKDKNILEKYGYRKVVFSVGILAVSAYMVYSFASRDVETTDNAVVRCDMIDITSEVSGILRDVYFFDNTYYQEGHLLAKIDDGLLLSEQGQAKSEFQLAEATLKAARVNESLTAINQESIKIIASATLDASSYKKESVAKQIKELISQLSAAKDTLDQAKRDLEREEILLEKNNVSRSRFDDTRLKYRTALSHYEAMFSKLESMKALEKVRQMEVVQSKESHNNTEKIQNIRLEQAKVQTEDAMAQLNFASEKLKYAGIKLDKTNIIAKRSGFVTNSRIFKGDFVEIGQPIASIISCTESVWVEANFKETQITKMKKGQRSEFYLDTYPDFVISGVVDGLSYGSGATFSVLPPENAVGNFTKVVQRFPVKIRIDQMDGVDLRAGMSAVVKVYTQDFVEPEEKLGSRGNQLNTDNYFVDRKDYD